MFTGNYDPYNVKKNTFFPPVIGRFIRFHPLKWYNKATLRMDFYGCELDGKMSPCEVLKVVQRWTTALAQVAKCGLKALLLVWCIQLQKYPCMLTFLTMQMLRLGCSVPLGMESGLIKDPQITASSTASKWYSGTWRPFLGRLNKEGTINAWQAKVNTFILT